MFHVPFCCNSQQMLCCFQIYCYTPSMAPPDELDELNFVVSKAIEAIKTWKAHQLLVVHQDQASLDITDQLCESKVLITQDFAMKFMPIQFREAQNDFFGKRGLSWHVSVVLRKNAHSQLESQS